MSDATDDSVKPAQRIIQGLMTDDESIKITHRIAQLIEERRNDNSAPHETQRLEQIMRALMTSRIRQ